MVSQGQVLSKIFLSSIAAGIILGSVRPDGGCLWFSVARVCRDEYIVALKYADIFGGAPIITRISHWTGRDKDMIRVDGTCAMISEISPLSQC